MWSHPMGKLSNWRVHFFSLVLQPCLCVENNSHEKSKYFLSNSLNKHQQTREETWWPLHCIPFSQQPCSSNFLWQWCGVHICLKSTNIVTKWLVDAIAWNTTKDLRVKQFYCYITLFGTTKRERVVHVVFLQEHTSPKSNRLIDFCCTKQRFVLEWKSIISDCLLLKSINVTTTTKHEVLGSEWSVELQILVFKLGMIWWIANILHKMNCMAEFVFQKDLLKFFSNCLYPFACSSSSTWCKVCLSCLRHLLSFSSSVRSLDSQIWCAHLIDL